MGSLLLLYFRQNDLTGRITLLGLTIGLRALVLSCPVSLACADNGNIKATDNSLTVFIQEESPPTLSLEVLR